VNDSSPPQNESPTPPAPHRRRTRYSGKNPRRYDQKYKEHQPELHPETIAKVIASGKTPAGSHLPVMLAEILEIFDPHPSQTFLDCTLGYGGHARELLARIQPNGLLIGLDVDPIEQPKTETRLRSLGFNAETFRTQRSNFAGIKRALALEGLGGVDGILADLGVSSMQLDQPERGFSVKHHGPLDMRMNPEKGISASQFLQNCNVADLTQLLIDNADEEHASLIAQHTAGRTFTTTTELSILLKQTLRFLDESDVTLSIRRTFQTLRIHVNNEFQALDTLLKHLPECLKPSGKVAILTFHSGEDRRVKKAFQSGLQESLYCKISDVIRPSPQECQLNPRSSSAKLRWAQKSL